MSLKLLEKYRILQLSENFKLAFRKVNYQDFEKLEEKIENSVFRFDQYYHSMTNLKRKFEWLSIRELLMELGINEDIIYDEHGKPHFEKGNGHLSISHSVDSIAVSKHKLSPHGIDLQHLNSKIIRIRDKFLREEEIDQLEENSVEELSIYWSMKEALFKLNGKKDIFLKGNLRITDLKNTQDHYSAKGEIFGTENEREVQMGARLIDDYVLAYTLIP